MRPEYDGWCPDQDHDSWMIELDEGTFGCIRLSRFALVAYWQLRRWPEWLKQRMSMLAHNCYEVEEEW